MIKIQVSDYGYFLIVDGYSIKRDTSNSYGIKITKFGNCKTNNFYASEFESISALRQYWNERRIPILMLVESTKNNNNL